MKQVAKQTSDRPKVAKGKRPYFFDDPNVDRLLAIVMALASEVSVLRDRVDTHEKLSDSETWASTTNVEAFDISENVEKERDEWRAEYLNRVLRIVTEELERMKRDAPDEDHDAIMEEVTS